MDVEKTIPIVYPYDMSKPLPSRIHNLNQDLFNPKPYEDWMAGDTCLYYDRQSTSIKFAVVTSIEQQDGSLYVRDLNRAERNTALLKAKEAFRTKDEILQAIFGPPPKD